MIEPKQYRHIGACELVFSRDEVPEGSLEVPPVEHDDEGNVLHPPVVFTASLSPAKESFLLAIRAVELVAKEKVKDKTVAPVAVPPAPPVEKGGK